MFIFTDESVARKHNLCSIGFMRQDIAIEISKNFTVVERQEQMLKC
jgi:hypothetical protein